MSTSDPEGMEDDAQPELSPSEEACVTRRDLGSDGEQGYTLQGLVRRTQS